MDKPREEEEENIFEIEELGFFVTVEHKDDKIIICGAEHETGRMLYKAISEGFGTPSLFKGNIASLFRFLRDGVTKMSETAKSHLKWRDDDEEGLFLCSTIKTEYFSRDFYITLPFTKGQDINCMLAFLRLAERKHHNALKRIESIGIHTCRTLPLELVGDWKHYGGYAQPSASKQGNLVIVSGLIENGKDQHLATLPEGYRPPYVLIFSQWSIMGAAVRVDVYPNGRVLLNEVTKIPRWVSLDGISFITE